MNSHLLLSWSPLRAGRWSSAPCAMTEQQKQEPQWEHRGHSRDRQEVEQVGASWPSSPPRTLRRRARQQGKSLRRVSGWERTKRREKRSPLTVSWAAAGVGTAAARHVAAAGVRATLAPADPQKQQEEDAAQDHRAHKRPLCKTDTQCRTGQVTVSEYHNALCINSSWTVTGLGAKQACKKILYVSIYDGAYRYKQDFCHSSSDTGLTSRCVIHFNNKNHSCFNYILVIINN